MCDRLSDDWGTVHSDENHQIPPPSRAQKPRSEHQWEGCAKTEAHGRVALTGRHFSVCHGLCPCLELPWSNASRAPLENEVGIRRGQSFNRRGVHTEHSWHTLAKVSGRQDDSTIRPDVFLSFRFLPWTESNFILLSLVASIAWIGAVFLKVHHSQTSSKWRLSLIPHCRVRTTHLPLRLEVPTRRVFWMVSSMAISIIQTCRTSATLCRTSRTRWRIGLLVCPSI